MARTQGARNSDYDEKRLSLARRVRERVLAQGGLDASTRELAREVGVSVATLRHYFGDRAGLLGALLETLRMDAAPHLARAATPVQGDVASSLRRFLAGLTEAWLKFGVGPLQAGSLALGLTQPGLGPAYVMHVLEPLLQSAESLLRYHVEVGDLGPCDVRVAALSLTAPVVLGLLHQDSLGGRACRPLALDAFLEDHLEAFLRARTGTAGALAAPRSRSRRRTPRS